MTYSSSFQKSFINVQLYPSDLLQKVNGSVLVPVFGLQKLLEVIDQRVEKLGIEILHGHIKINNSYVSFTINESYIIDSIEDCHGEIRVLS